MTDIQEKAKQLTQSEIMDKLSQMQEEMFMTGHNAALKSVLPMVKSANVSLTNLVNSLETFLKENDLNYEAEVAEAKSKSDLEMATELSQFTNRVMANMENVKNKDN